ncbi:hypothetical protein L195_g021660 [Trifolium pratense]|uniref:Uncharacterized protein n=1 Tax=Trifolium pratense TaxID=57577 RepID=A0A2K3N5T8_TRIPR|nr:hypothetical protein L195_g021660 [Trifolium pratense]
MVSIALLLFRPNPNFVLLLPVVEPDRLDSFPSPPASHFVSFFFFLVAGMKTPDRPDFPQCPPPALLLSGSGFFASFQSSWSTGKKEMNECSFGKMYKNTPTETKAKGVRLRERFAKESCGAVKGFPLGFPAPWSSPNCGRGEPTYKHEEKKRGERVPCLRLRCQGGRRRPQVEATEALVIQLTPPVRACCHAGKSRAFGLTYYWI